MKSVLILFLLLISASVCLSQEQQIRFTDGSELLISENNINSSSMKQTGRLIKKEVVATITGFGKAREFTPVGKLLNGTEENKFDNISAKERKSFLNNLDKITTEFEFKQSGGKFHSNGLSSIDNNRFIIDLYSVLGEKPESCKVCEVKLKLILIELKIENEIYYTPVIISIERLRKGN